MPGKWLIAPATAAALMIGSAAAASASTHAAPYYLSLGDSLSVGFQPDAQGVGHPTGQGFDHDVQADLGHSVRLTELGCPAETTTSMINGGVCAYPGAKSQLDAAVNFLSAHRGQVALVTIVIGATDVENCATPTGIDLACVGQGVGAIQANLPVILDRLKAAAPNTGARFVGVNLYDPFLAAFVQGDQGQALARQSVPLTQQVNGILAAAYTKAGAKVADVETAFHTTEFTSTTPPLNVATICADTYMCAAPPVGPNIHPNPSGYRLMANAVEAQLRHCAYE
ncbi:GDSL-type esterase/lipase family protein [Kutzneria buriramensis]|uniref:GDSL-like lipase/acylhydrolase family protein n=1 Tax=Kutzneria buriramensis TaxID=1045776 RepID=A0A3E0HZ24_9PSEU|nr:GDSL-type esterase/lipase family protein [Kutzneria buriramensis]REH51560.1 GDSL-like lipase/acylhydrolase family protein [Kutzneria buriramensis]